METPVSTRTMARPTEMEMCIRDSLCCGIDQLSIIALQTDSDFLFDCHCLRLLKKLILP